MNPDIYPILNKYLNETETNLEEVFTELKSLRCSNQEIASYIWTLIDLSKGNNIFNENANSKLRELINYLANNSKKYKRLFFLFLDRVDTNQFQDISEMRKSMVLASRNRYKIEKYQLFHTNPEGFSRLLLIFFLRFYHPEELIQIIGEHKIDPDVALNILFDLILRFKKYQLIRFLSVFSLNQILPIIIDGISKKKDNFYYCILSNLLQMKQIKYSNLYNFYGNPYEMLSKIYSNYLSSVETHSKDLTVVRTILPGSTKEESYPPTYFEHENACKKHKSDLCSTIYFQLLANSYPFDFDLYGQISEFDPCLYLPIRQTVSNALYIKFLKNPIDFLRTQENLNYLCTLGCHCTQNKLIVGICRYPKQIPPYLFSNFILPSISLNDCAWPLSIDVYDCIMNYPMRVRKQIYNKFSENQHRIGDSIIKISSATRKITSILFKRLSKENIDQYTTKIAKLFLIAPSIATSKLIEYLFTIISISSIPFLIISDLSPLSLDFLLLDICDKIENKTTFSEWPIEIASFLGKTFSEHYKSMDLAGYISFIRKGLKKNKYPYLCLLKSLITEMGTVNYRGNLSKSDIELRTGDNLIFFNRKLNTEDAREFNSSSKIEYLQALLLEKGTTIDILHSLNMQNDESDPDNLDKLRFTFITFCDFLKDREITSLSPAELIGDFHFSLPVATHVSRSSIRGIEVLSPKEVPSELFGRFWFYNCRDFHLPTMKYEEIDEQFQTRIERTTDPEFCESLIYVREQLNAAMINQRNRIERIRSEISDKKWFTSPEQYVGFVNHCIVPRMLFSQEDARFCALFVFSIAHFTDFQLKTFNNFFIDKLHFFILAATFEESRCIGLFLSKLLKYVRDQCEDDATDLHSNLIEKFEIVLRHCLLSNSEFLMIKTITVLDWISKDFPISNEHEEILKNLLDQLNSIENQSISTQIKRYFSNRSSKLAKKDRKRSLLLSQPAEKEEEESYGEDDYSDESGNREDGYDESDSAINANFKQTSSPSIARSLSTKFATPPVSPSKTKSENVPQSKKEASLPKSNSTSKIKRFKSEDSAKGGEIDLVASSSMPIQSSFNSYLGQALYYYNTLYSNPLGQFQLQQMIAASGTSQDSENNQNSPQRQQQNGQAQQFTYQINPLLNPYYYQYK